MMEYGATDDVVDVMMNGVMKDVLFKRMAGREDVCVGY